ncbi:MAG: hypothetical protein FJ026_09125, partial [Chloroflexi bacterium]|nr:hypothetical protein [Chloroflexota bacterium]
RPYLLQVAGRFQRLWEGQERDWMALDVPEAARRRLLRYCPGAAPARDPLQRQEPTTREEAKPLVTAEAQQRERVLFQFLRDAPYLLDNRWLGATTSAIRPWPHQARIADTVIDRFPERFLLCDEVGLGKTIEAGLVLRQLLLSGQVRRCLILAPKSVCRQWQEELYEKFALHIPLFDGAIFRDVFNQESPASADNPWDAADVLIASSQLAKRRERAPELLAARPWDLVLVDEAHHARRKDFLVKRYRPNRLLELLMGREGQPGLKDRTRGLLLLTATPMQVHPVEVWDLLQVLGLGGRWGADEEHFLRFFQELRQPQEADWDWVLDMVRDVFRTGGQLDPLFAQQARAQLGLVDWERLRSALEGGGSIAARQLGPPVVPVLAELARQHTPLRRYLFRSTRRLLRHYARQGLLHEPVPTREPRPVWITMQPEELELYNRIVEYISQFYHKYEGERKGLGFVMTVYRRRLTSSFYAVGRSLERRLAFLLGKADLGLAEEDYEQDELSADVGEQLDEEGRSRYQGEIEYVRDFVAALGRLGGNDSKVAQLLVDLEQLFRQRPSVLIFTQYTDTMDFLREQLRQVYSGQVACYSGRGGEVWNGITWVPTTKEEIKNAFRQGERVRILLGTEAASEGLNLQTCGVLINYDMPWNPMRVEQRIGRIDRIGQMFDRVWIRHYFYQDTVEARVYQALENRIRWFEDVVGELQPILAGMEEAIKTAAMAQQAERERVLATELAQLSQALEAQEASGLVLERYLAEEQAAVPSPASPVTLEDLKRVLLDSLSLGGRFQAHGEFPGAYWLRLDGGRRAVTLDTALFDAHPDTVQLLTYGNPLLAQLLDAMPEPQATATGRLLRCSTEDPPPVCAYYALRADGRPERVRSLPELQAILADPGAAVAAWPEEAQRQAREDFQQETIRRQERQAEVVATRQRADRLEVEEQARQVLLHAALVELAMGQQPDLFEQAALPMAFNETAVTGLRRHGHPWAPLLKLVSAKGLSPSAADPFFAEVQGQPREVLAGKFAELKKQAARLVRVLAAPQWQQAGADLPAVSLQLLG